MAGPVQLRPRGYLPTGAGYAAVWIPIYMGVAGGMIQGGMAGVLRATLYHT